MFTADFYDARGNNLGGLYKMIDYTMSEAGEIFVARATQLNADHAALRSGGTRIAWWDAEDGIEWFVDVPEDVLCEGCGEVWYTHELDNNGLCIYCTSAHALKEG